MSITNPKENTSASTEDLKDLHITSIESLQARGIERVQLVTCSICNDPMNYLEGLGLTIFEEKLVHMKCIPENSQSTSRRFNPEVDKLPIL